VNFKFYFIVICEKPLDNENSQAMETNLLSLELQETVDIPIKFDKCYNGHQETMINKTLHTQTEEQRRD
jgi:hypothetical protein